MRELYQKEKKERQERKGRRKIIKTVNRRI
jgi:hypothetical protein